MNFERVPSPSRAWLVLSTVIAVLAGCQHTPPPGPADIPAPPRQVETGSRFVLFAPVTFAPGSTEALFQNQQVVSAARLSPNMPYCRLKPQAAGGVLGQPDTFTVGAVDYDEKELGSSGAMVSVTRIALRSISGQPSYNLSCGWAEGAPSRGFVSTQQIYDAIGGSFSMNLLR